MQSSLHPSLVQNPSRDNPVFAEGNTGILCFRRFIVTAEIGHAQGIVTRKKGALKMERTCPRSVSFLLRLLQRIYHRFAADASSRACARGDRFSRCSFRVISV